MAKKQSFPIYGIYPALTTDKVVCLKALTFFVGSFFMTLLTWKGASDDEKDGKDDDAKGEGEGAACLFCGRCHEQRQPTASDA